MGRMLMVLSADGTIESLVDDGPPFDEVELLDCHKGEAGDVFEFGQAWRGLLEKHFGATLPPYVKIKAKDEPAEEAERRLTERIKKDVIALRRVIKDPVLLQWDEQGLMKIGIEPSGLGSACDQRAMVHYQDLGCTEVSYTPNGVAVRIYDDSGSPPVFEWQIDAEELLAWRDGAAHRNG